MVKAEKTCFVFLLLIRFLVGQNGLLFAQTPHFKHLTIGEGLSNNNITSLLKDPDGFLWIGTPSGLNRYDGHTVNVYKSGSANSQGIKDNAVQFIFEGPESRVWVRTGLGINILDTRTDAFLMNIDSVFAEMGLEVGNVSDIQKDKLGNFWFLIDDKGLFKYNSKDKKTEKYSSRHSQQITGISNGKKQNLWIVYEDGVIESLNLFTLEIQVSEKLKVSGNFEYRIFIDNRDNPWVYASGASSGLYWWPDFSTEPKHFSIHSERFRLNNNTIMGVAQDENSRIWIATDHGGVNLFDKRAQKMSYLMHEDFNERSLIHNGISSMICDGDGMVWVGTYKGGLSYYHESLIQFPVIKHSTNVSHSLPYNDVNRFVEDKEGNLWIGTNGGGLIFYNKSQNVYKQYLHDSQDPKSLGSNVIVSLLIDKQDNLWVGTYHGGLNSFKNGGFLRYINDAQNPHSISNNSIWELFEDSKGRLWVGTLAGGLNILDRDKGIFLKSGKDFTGPSSSYICSIMEEKSGNLWFGTATGIEVLDPQKNTITKYGYTKDNPYSLSNEYISDLLQDTKGRIWIATRDGLNLFDRNAKGFIKISESDGLQDNTIQTLLEDNTGKIWLSTSKGISVVSSGKSNEWLIRNFDKHDGLQGTAFNENSALKLKSGELIFGGPLGFNRIKPGEFSQEKIIPKPKIVAFLLFNKPIKTGEEIKGKVILKNAIEYTDEIILNHDQNVFSLGISSLYFLHPERVRIKYKMEGFTKEWLELDGKSKLATFTNLNAGTYIFKVIVSTDGEEWSKPYELIRIVIKPPFWLSVWAYIFYIIVAGGVFFAIRYIEKKRQKTRFILHQEREEAKRLKELDQLKTKFFTNVSHEFRTPVTLIVSPLEKLVSEESDPLKKSHLELVQRNARRLLNLVNQLLDFRKVDTKSLQIHHTSGNLMEMILDYACSFKDLAESKGIWFDIHVPHLDRICYFDYDKLERIVFNLLSNAFKFTPAGGKVNITAEIEEDSILTIIVEDTGIGIYKASQSRIFERFYQDDILKPLLNQGSGIGLSITKEYINVLGGTLNVESETDLGSRFLITLPLKTLSAEDATIDQAPLYNKSKFKGKVSGHKVLIVEDNEDFRFYLTDNLKDYYYVEEALNAAEGWEKALAFHPDIIVSDVNMPGSSGIELCQKLKLDSRTLHIPIILLTALTDNNYQMAGIEAGASDYVVKPFNVELLLSKIKTHIKLKASLEKTYRKQLAVEPSEMKRESADEKFMRKALNIVERNISNTLFSVEALAEQMNVSRVGLYKRVFTLSGYSPSEFIRIMRIKRAAKLLEETGMTVAEVSYEVGFNNPKVFSKYFKEIFGKIPSEYRKTAK